MRAMTIPTNRPIRLGRQEPQALPRPMVQRLIVPQTVNLKPMGNTVAVTTLSGNPFEGGQRVSIKTQASGGMAPCPTALGSRSLVHSYLPGIGEDPAPAAPAAPGAMAMFTSALTTGVDMFKTQQATKLTAQQAALAQQQAAIEAERTKQGMLSQQMSILGQRKSIVIPLLAVAGVALLVGGFLWMKKRKSGAAA